MGRAACASSELTALSALEPSSQADLLTRLAQQARLIRMALDDARSDAEHVASSFERALGVAMDAEESAAAELARLQLASVLHDARCAGLKLSASVDELQLDGVLGAQRLPVLTAVLSAA
ncbi:MAG: hypothetical protein MUC68_10825 [Burkholderiaceae bacterium]|nr:hypothetical protein [Burkholderiaceae bacterium]